jgi:hypothetical protein
MKSTYLDFIGVYKDVVPDGYCEHMIAEFERVATEGVGSTRQQFEGVSPHHKEDHFMFLDRGAGTHFMNFGEQLMLDPFYAATQTCFDDYSSRFSVLKDNRVTGSAAKMQRTLPGQGYHLWHAEQGRGPDAARVLAYMLYLNTLEPEEGGETEFLYQRLRLRPEENTMVVWPAAFTHAHRGNVVLGDQAKYIITGWFCYD